MKPRACIFDAYGTLFDVHSVVLREGAGFDGDLRALSIVWRRKQLEYTWLRTLMERYEDFWSVTEAALRAAACELSIAITDQHVERLMGGYLSPSVFPDVVATLERLKSLPMAILSNGSPTMLDAAVRNNGLEAYFAEIISVDGVRTYKPSPRAYALGPQGLRMPAGDILFISSNSWDAAGATAFGYRVCWCNRAGSNMERLGFTPDFVVPGLDRIPELLELGANC